MFISEVYLNILLETLRIFKFKIVWTAHNLLPHEKTFRDDIRVVLDLAKKVDIIIMLNSSVADDLIDLNHDLKDKIQVIPQGNYIKYYDFQHKLSNSDKTIYGFVGKIRPYKGLHDLIQIFKEIKCTNIKLQIVGKSNDEKYFQKLVNLSKGDSRITIENRYVQPSNLAKIVSGFDILVLPFTSITNSSTAMLAFSAKKPILAPRIGGMLDYPQNIGIFYDPINRDNLRIAIEKAADEQNNLQKLGENAFEYAKLNDWKNIAKKTVNLYLELAKS
jgi:glycosyltransferase involved in cell wall biosynthesis